MTTHHRQHYLRFWKKNLQFNTIGAMIYDHNFCVKRVNISPGSVSSLNKILKQQKLSKPTTELLFTSTVNECPYIYRSIKILITLIPKIFYRTF